MGYGLPSLCSVQEMAAKSLTAGRVTKSSRVVRDGRRVKFGNNEWD